ncbi:hypothetical protein AB0E44_11020 [Micrococcus terreus]|uniref:hypothetical protein n=1 Tax=Micrococcus terreus TaxID=574650 RepID=UPI003405739D
MPQSRSRTKKRKKNKNTPNKPKALGYHFSPRVFLYDLERISASGTRVLGEHLAQRMGHRRKAVAEDSQRLPSAAWEYLSQVPKADAALIQAERGIPRVGEEAAAEAWGDTLRHEVETYTSVVQNLRSGLDYGFLIGARMVFERWSTNRSLSLGLVKQDNEPDSDFYSRIWADATGRWDTAPGTLWAQLSEYLHGRAGMPEASKRYEDLTRASNGPALDESIVQSALSLGFLASYQMLACVNGHASARGFEVDDDFVQKRTRILTASDPTWTDLLETLAWGTHPSDFIAVESIDRDFKSLATHYDELIQSPSSIATLIKVSLGIHLAGCLARHRINRLEIERDQLRWEASHLLDHSIEYFGSLLYRYSAFSEMALLLGAEVPSYGGDALRTAGMALNSAWRLWLDDDDLSIACIRAVFEQTARARAHRLKSPKATQMETRQQSPRRWLEAAGYKRLAPVGRALGEFSHYTAASRRSDARRLLVEAQIDPLYEPEKTARGHLLQQAAYFLATEVAERLKDPYPNLSEEFAIDVALTELSDGHDAMEKYLNLSHGKKTFDWDTLDFIGSDK